MGHSLLPTCSCYVIYVEPGAWAAQGSTVIIAGMGWDRMRAWIYQNNKLLTNRRRLGCKPKLQGWQYHQAHPPTARPHRNGCRPLSRNCCAGCEESSRRRSECNCQCAGMSWPGSRMHVWECCGRGISENDVPRGHKESAGGIACLRVDSC